MINPQQDLLHYTDEELGRLVKQSDKRALLVLFDRYAGDLYSYILPLVRTRTLETPVPEDIVQRILIDIFTSLWDAHKILQLPTTVRTYLFSAAYNKAIHYVRYRKEYISAASVQLCFGEEPCTSQESDPIRYII